MMSGLFWIAVMVTCVNRSGEMPAGSTCLIFTCICGAWIVLTTRSMTVTCFVGSTDMVDLHGVDVVRLCDGLAARLQRSVSEMIRRRLGHFRLQRPGRQWPRRELGGRSCRRRR